MWWLIPITCTIFSFDTKFKATNSWMCYLYHNGYPSWHQAVPYRHEPCCPLTCVKSKKVIGRRSSMWPTSFENRFKIRPANKNTRTSTIQIFPADIYKVVLNKSLKPYNSFFEQVVFRNKSGLPTTYNQRNCKLSTTVCCWHYVDICFCTQTTRML